jgi:hypothetical protein
MAKDPLGQESQDDTAQDLTCKTVTEIVETFYHNVNYFERREARQALRTLMKNCYLPGILLIYQFAGLPYSPGTTLFKKLLHIFHRRQLKTCLTHSQSPWSKPELFQRALTNVLHVCVAVDFF